MIDPLDLHGPGERIQAAVDAARAGRCLLTSPSGRGPAMADRLDVALTGHGFFVQPLTGDHTFDHCAEMLNVGSISDPGRLLQNPDLNRQVLKIDCSTAPWREWAILVLQRLAAGAPPQCLRFWLVWPDELKRPGAKSLHSVDWSGCITPTDVRIYAADRFRNRQGPGPTNYWECLAVELAGPDLDLIDRLAALTTPLLDPIAWLRSCGAAAHVPVQYDGMQRFESPIALAARSTSDQVAAGELERRIWTAQARSLFCGMEASRPSVLGPYKAELDRSYRSDPDPEVCEIPRDVEWGPAFVRLRAEKSVPESTKSLLIHARAVRNAIAHGEAVDARLLGHFIGAAAISIKGRWAT